MSSRSRTVIRVKPSASHWVVTLGSHVVSETRTKTDAEETARGYGRNVEAVGGLAQVVVQRSNGTFEKEWTYGQDPRRTRG